MTETRDLVLSTRGTDARRVYFDPVFQDADLLSTFTIIPNVATSLEIAFASKLENILRKKSGCGFKPVGDMEVYKRCISTELIAAEVEQCFDEFLQTFLVDSYNSGNDVPDLTGTALALMIMDRVMQGIKLDIDRLAWFGRKDSANPANNIIDGLWSVYLPELKTQGLISYTDSNSGSALGIGEAIQILDGVFEGASNELKGFDQAQKCFFVSSNVFERLQKDARDGVTGDAVFIQMLEGREVMSFRGVKVVPMYRWQELAAQHMAHIVPGIGNNANLVLYTTPQNLVLATNVLAEKDRVDMRYDYFEQINQVKATFRLGVNYIHPSLISIAY